MNRRILLIDADPAFRANLAQQLGRYRFDIVVEPDADEALANVASQPPALIVLAVDEPEKAGYKVFQRLRKGPLSKTPIVLATSSVSPESFSKHRTLKIHADEYLDKRTLGKDELLGKLDNLIGLGETVDDDLDIPVEIDDIPLHDGDMVLDETVGEGGSSDEQLDQMVSAETDAAFDALMGPDDAPPRPATAPPRPATAPPASRIPSEAEQSQIATPIHDDSVPAAIHDSKRFDPDEDSRFDTFSRESIVPPPEALGTIRQAPPEELPQEMRAAVHRFESSPAIQLDADDLQPLEEDSGGVPEPVPHANLVARDDDVPAPEPARPRFVDAPTMADARIAPAAPVVDLGLDAIAQDAESEQSGVYDRRSLRKIGELERQISQLKTELDRQRASGESSARGASREREFLTLREQIIARDKDLQRAKTDLAARERELADAEDRLRQAQQARIALEGKSAELEQRLAADSSRAESLESKERTMAAQLLQAQHDLESRTQALAAAEAARTQTERDLASERATRAASASDAERALRVEREQMIARHQGELGSLRMEHAGGQAMALEKQRQEMVNAHGAGLDALRKEHGAALDVSRQQLDTARKQHAAALDTLREELGGQHAAALAAAVEAGRQEIATEADQALGQLETQHAGDMASLKEEHAAALARLGQERDAKIAGARDEHATTVARLSQEHAAAIDQHQRTHAGAIEEHERTHAQAIEQHQAAHAAEVARLQEEHATTQEQYALALSKQASDHAAELARVRDELTGQVAAVTSARDRAIAEMTAELGRVRVELANAQAALTRGLEDMASQHAAELEEQANQHAEIMAGRERELVVARQDEAIAHTAALAELKAELDRQAATHGIKLDGAKKELDDVLALHEQAKAKLADDHTRAVAEQAAVHAAEVAHVADEKQRALDDIHRAQAEHRAAEERHREELAQHKEQAEREASEFHATLIGAKRTMEEAAARHQVERDAADQAHAQTLAEQKAQHERAIAVLNGEVIKVKAFGDAEHSRAMAAKEADHERQRKESAAEHAKAVKDLTAERDELQRGLSAARDTIKRSETELGSAVQTIADRNSELRSHGAAITERDQRIADLRKEIASLEAENASYQEQVLRAYQKLKSDEAMVARAKKAMAIALTVLDDQPKTDPT